MDQEITCGVMPMAKEDTPASARKVWAWLDDNFEKIFRQP